GRIAIVHPEGGELPDLEEGCARIEQLRDAVARQELASSGVPGPPLRRAGPRPSPLSSGHRPEPASRPRCRGIPTIADLFVSSMPATPRPPDHHATACNDSSSHKKRITPTIRLCLETMKDHASEKVRRLQVIRPLGSLSTQPRQRSSDTWPTLQSQEADRSY